MVRISEFVAAVCREIGSNVDDFGQPITGETILKDFGGHEEPRQSDVLRVLRRFYPVTSGSQSVYENIDDVKMSLARINYAAALAYPAGHVYLTFDSQVAGVVLGGPESAGTR